MKHYWTENDVPDTLLSVKTCLGNDFYTFKTAEGVFAKSSVDFGSMLLVRAMLEELDQTKENNYQVLDVGAGYGVMSIVLAKNMVNSRFDMVDVSRRAVYLSETNIEAYNLTERCTVFQSDVYQNVNGQYDFIICNPPIRTGKKIVHQILIGALDFLKDDGALVFVMRKNHGLKSAIKALEEKFTKVEILKKDKGFFIVKATK